MDTIQKNKNNHIYTSENKNHLTIHKSKNATKKICVIESFSIINGAVEGS